MLSQFHNNKSHLYKPDKTSELVSYQWTENEFYRFGINPSFGISYIFENHISASLESNLLVFYQNPLKQDELGVKNRFRLVFQYLF